MKACECDKPGPCPRYNACMTGRLYFLCQNEPEKLANFTRGDKLPTQCGQDRVTPHLEAQAKYHRDLNTISLPPPVERFGTVPASWLVGITTAPRQEPTIERSIVSIQKAGWDRIHVFAEPSSEGAAAVAGRVADEVISTRDPNTGVLWHQNEEKLGPWRNFAQMVSYFATETSADAYLLCQDDAQFFHGPVREYLERHALWITPKPHLMSLYTSSMYLQKRGGEYRGAGWHTLGRGGKFGWWGAVAFVLSRESLLHLHASDIFQGWLQRRKAWLFRHPSTIAQVDTALGFWAPTQGGLWTCLPSLVQHVGDTSTIYKSNRAVGRRMAQWMMGTPPAHLPPGFLQKAQSAVISVARWAGRGFAVAEKQLRKRRMAICLNCEHLDKKKMTCNLCGCYIEAKTLMPHEKCPHDPPKWQAVSDAPPTTPPQPCGACH